jgi:acetyltransferase-like isoleucine patch superfamily enzyme
MRRIASLVQSEFLDWIGWILLNIPGKIGVVVQQILLCARLRKCGVKFLTGTGCKFSGLNDIEIGDGVAFLGQNYMLSGVSGSIKIGSRVAVNFGTIVDAAFGSVEILDDCIIGPNVIIRASNHNFSRTDIPI